MVLLWSFVNALWLCVFLIVSVAVYVIVKFEIPSNKVTKNYYKEIFSESDGDKAMIELKKAKDKLDLGLITQQEYENLKNELSKYIK